MRRAAPVFTPPPVPLDIRLMNNASALLVAVFGGLALAALLGWFGRQPVFSLKTIHIDNELVHNNAVTLRANVAPKLAGNFFSVDLARTRAAFESIPWVRHAVVRREFPDRLRVLVQEHQAVAFWGAEADARLINSRARPRWCCRVTAWWHRW